MNVFVKSQLGYRPVKLEDQENARESNKNCP